MDPEINKSKEHVLFVKEKFVFRKCKTFLLRKRKSDPKLLEKNVSIRFDTKLITLIADRFDNCVVLQKFNPGYYARSVGIIDPFRGKKIVKI